MGRSSARSFYLLAVMLLFFGVAFSQTIENFTGTYFDSDVTIQKDVLDSSGLQYTLISVEGKEVFVLDPSNSPVLDSAKIGQILKDDLIHDSNYQAKISQVKSAMSQFEATRQENDSYCKQLTGTTNLPANNEEEAKTACQANPNCQMGLYNAPDAMAYVVSWYTNSTAITSDDSQFIKNADSLSSSKAAVDSELALLTKIETEVSNIESNILFQTQLGEGGYEYCPKVDYSKPSLASVRSTLMSMEDTMAQIQQAGDRAANIVSNSNAQIAYASQRSPLADALKKKAFEESAQLRLDFDNLNSKVDMAGLEPNVALLEEYSANISKLAAAGSYSKAMSLEAPFDSLYAGTQSDLAAQKNRYDKLTASLKATKDKIASARQALTGPALDSIDAIDAQASQIEGATKTQMSPSDVASYATQLAGLDTQINEVVAQAALSGNAKAPPSSSQQETVPSASLFGIALPSAFAGVPQAYLIAGAVVALVFIIAIIAVVLSLVKSLLGKGSKGKGREPDRKEQKKK
ncbi:MAG: hypothetical protein WC506_06195 [Candidatus Micrarchaeia archaeon]